jgi:hypothetical protein
MQFAKFKHPLLFLYHPTYFALRFGTMSGWNCKKGLALLGLLWGNIHHEAIHDLTPKEDEMQVSRHAGMDGRHPGSEGCSGNIHVNLGSSTPCWNDVIEGLCVN